MRQFEEKFGKRVLVSCHDLSFNLQGCVAENEEGPTTNVRFNEKQTNIVEVIDYKLQLQVQVQEHAQGNTTQHKLREMSFSK